MVDLFLKALLGVVVGGIVVASVYAVINRNDIATTIRRAFFERYSTTEDQEAANLLAAIIREKQADSVSVDVFFKDVDQIKTETLSIKAEAIDDSIHVGSLIPLGSIPTLDELDFPSVNLENLSDFPSTDDADFPSIDDADILPIDALDFPTIELMD